MPEPYNEYGEFACEVGAGILGMIGSDIDAEKKEKEAEEAKEAERNKTTDAINNHTTEAHEKTRKVMEE